METISCQTDKGNKVRLVKFSQDTIPVWTMTCSSVCLSQIPGAIHKCVPVDSCLSSIRPHFPSQPIAKYHFCTWSYHTRWNWHPVPQVRFYHVLFHSIILCQCDITIHHLSRWRRNIVSDTSEYLPIFFQTKNEREGYNYYSCDGVHPSHNPIILWLSSLQESWNWKTFWSLQTSAFGLPTGTCSLWMLSCL